MTLTIEQEFQRLVDFYVTNFKGKSIKEILGHGIFDNMGLLQKRILLDLFNSQSFSNNKPVASSDSLEETPFKDSNLIATDLGKQSKNISFRNKNTMKDIQYIYKFEKIINLIEEARDIAEDIGEDLIYDALDNIRTDLNEKYDDDVS